MAVVRWVLVAAALAGVWVAAELLGVQYGVGGPLAQVACGEGGGDCRAVSTSRFGTIPLGPVQVPNALVGLWYYSGMLIWLVAVGRPSRTRRVWQALVIAVAAVAVASSVVYAYLMFVVLKRTCPLCVASYAVNLGLLIGAIVMWPRPAAAAPPSPPRPAGRYAAVVLALIVAVVAAESLYLIAMHNLRQAQRYMTLWHNTITDPVYVQWKHRTSPSVDLALRADETAIGPADASHTVVVWSDYQCPPCAQTHEQLIRVATLWSRDLRLVLRHLPQSSDVPKAMGIRGPYTHSFRAACAAEAVRRIGGIDAFLAYSDLLFDRGRRLDASMLTPLAQQAGIGDLDAFETLRQSQPVADRVIEDMRLARRLGIRATPAVYLDGRRVRAPRGFQPGRSEADTGRTIQIWAKLLNKRAPATAYTTSRATVP